MILLQFNNVVEKQPAEKHGLQFLGSGVCFEWMMIVEDVYNWK